MVRETLTLAGLNVVRETQTMAANPFLIKIVMNQESLFCFQRYPTNYTICELLPSKNKSFRLLCMNFAGLLFLADFN